MSRTHSASLIAEALGTTTSAVLGKAHRLKISLTKDGNYLSRDGAPRVTPPKKADNPPAPHAVPVSVLRSTVAPPPEYYVPGQDALVEALYPELAREDGCLWPLGSSDEGFSCCGARRRDRRYCAEHAQVSRRRPGNY